MRARRLRRPGRPRHRWRVGHRPGDRRAVRPRGRLGDGRRPRRRPRRRRGRRHHRAGGQARFVRADVAEPDQVTAMVAAVEEEFGRLDVAVNNAGMPGTYKPFHDQHLDDWQRTLDVNLTGMFLCLQAEIPAILDVGRGAIVNVASAAGLWASPTCRPTWPASTASSASPRRGPRVRPPGHPGQRGVPRQRAHADARRLRRRRPGRAAGHGQGATRSAGWARPPRSPRPSCGCAPTRRRSSPATPWPSTAACSPPRTRRTHGLLDGAAGAS